MFLPELNAKSFSNAIFMETAFIKSVSCCFRSCLWHPVVRFTRSGIIVGCHIDISESFDRFGFKRANRSYRKSVSWMVWSDRTNEDVINLANRLVAFRWNRFVSIRSQMEGHHILIKYISRQRPLIGAPSNQNRNQQKWTEHSKYMVQKAWIDSWKPLMRKWTLMGEGSLTLLWMFSLWTDLRASLTFLKVTTHYE